MGKHKRIEKSRIFTADFETTTQKDDCRVWAYGICEINDDYTFTYGNSIVGFFQHLANVGGIYYFHNLKFDGEFILSYLLRNGYKFTNYRKLNSNEFTCLISELGVWYSIEINIDGITSIIYDSLKLLNFSVDKIAKGFNLNISKLSIDYKKYREVDYVLTKDEIEYLKNDVMIMAQALHLLFQNGLTKMTIGSNALEDFKITIGKDKFKKYFPILEEDGELRQGCYKGGYSYVNEKFKNITCGSGLVFDVNSLYPSIMMFKQLPYDTPIFYKGGYVEDTIYPLYIQNLKCSFKLKEGFLPTIQLKNNYGFNATEYLKDSGNDEVILQLTNIDLDLFLKHYEVYNLEYLNGYKFKSTNNIFCQYISKWNEKKELATIEGNNAKRTIAKLMMNSLYGKFAKNPRQCKKIPYLENGILKFKNDEIEITDSVYLPVGAFITSYARQQIIASAQDNFDRFAYADTDSLHLIIDIPDDILKLEEKEILKLSIDDLKSQGVDIPNLKIDNVKLGYFKLESVFEKAKYLRAKSYIEVLKNKNNIVCAGMTKGSYPFVTFENFKLGTVYGGKLKVTHVKGGLILEDTTFTIKA